LLNDSPELIPTKVEDQAAIFTREAGLPGSGSTDLVGVDAQGNILIVETKLARNGEIRRKVIGQVLEYACPSSKLHAREAPSESVIYQTATFPSLPQNGWRTGEDVTMLHRGQVHERGVLTMDRAF
jgi:hypothetical protein